MPPWYPVAIRGISSSSAARPSFSPDRVCLGISTHPTLTMIMRWKYLRFSPPSQTRLATSTQRFRATHGFSFNRVVPNRYYNIVYTYLFYSSPGGIFSLSYPSLCELPSEVLSLVLVNTATQQALIGAIRSRHDSTFISWEMEKEPARNGRWGGGEREKKGRRRGCTSVFEGARGHPYPLPRDLWPRIGNIAFLVVSSNEVESHCKWRDQEVFSLMITPWRNVRSEDIQNSEKVFFSSFLNNFIGDAPPRKANQGPLFILELYGR